MADVRLPLEHAERVLHGVDQRPVEVEELLSRSSCKDDVGQASAGSSPLGEITAKIV